MEKKLFTSESVTEGHPDKLCDSVADAILDAIIEKDPDARVACEVCAITGFLLIMGEISTTAEIDYEKVARDTIKEIGYTDDSIGFDGNTCEIKILIDEQSADIAMGVDKSIEVRDADGEESMGAGDQGMMFGYATTETKELMPFPISLAHKLSRKLTELRKEKILPYLRPDGKTQVSVEYDENGRPKRVDTIVVSTQHDETVSQEQIHKDIKEKLIDAVVPEGMIDDDTRIYINPTGQFIIGGPNGDSGLTGRKIIVDTYGGYARHGGGAFSGKDASKVDRSASYAARYVAKNIVAAGLADKCEIQVSYAIGVATPTSIMVDTFKTGKLPDDKIEEIVRENFDLRPDKIIAMLDLKKPTYKKSTNYGHFGKEDEGLTWEKTDKVDVLKKYL